MLTHRAPSCPAGAGSARLAARWGARLTLLSLCSGALLVTAGCDLLWQPYIATFPVDCPQVPQSCGADGPCDLSPGCPGDGSDGPGPLPATCAQLQQLGNQIDAEYTLYINGQTDQPYTVFCYQMATTPTEYLTLSAAAMANVGRYSAALPAIAVTTEYQRVRFDPAKLQIICDDQTFTTPSKVTLPYNGISVSAVPFGVAIACVGSSAVGRIDLSGTAFAVPMSALAVSGGSPGMTQAKFSMNDQVVALAAQGSCGHLSPTPLVSQQLSLSSGQRLQLKYIGR